MNPDIDERDQLRQASRHAFIRRFANWYPDDIPELETSEAEISNRQARDFADQAGFYLRELSDFPPDTKSAEYQRDYYAGKRRR